MRERIRTRRPWAAVFVEAGRASGRIVEDQDAAELVEPEGRGVVFAVFGDEGFQARDDPPKAPDQHRPEPGGDHLEGRGAGVVKGVEPVVHGAEYRTGAEGGG